MAPRRPSREQVSREQKQRYEAAMNEFEHAVRRASNSARRTAVHAVQEDERLRQNAREMLLHISRARVAAHAGGAIALARTDPDARERQRRRSLQDIALVSGAAAKVAMDTSVEDMRRERLQRKARKRDNSDDSDDSEEGGKRGRAQPVFEQLEKCSERVLRAELAVARRIAEAKRDVKEGAKRFLRAAVEDVGESLLPEGEEAKRRRQKELFDARPQLLDALLSGDTHEISAAFEVLAGPLVLYARHYNNFVQMWPKILLILIGLPVMMQQQFTLGDQCVSVIKIRGHTVLAMSAWLTMQILTDIAIVITRYKRHTLTAPVVRAFSRGEGVEAARLRKTARALLFTSFVRHNLTRLASTRSTRRSGKRRQAADRPSASSRHSGDREERPRPRSGSADSEEGSDRGEDAPPHALDAVIPVEEASERGERALLALAQVENSGTRVPLALLTILSFFLGLCGGIYLLLPINRPSCQPVALILANSYIAFFYIFFVPNVLVCTTAIIEMATLRKVETNRLERYIDYFMGRIDDILFLGQVPVCAFLAKRLLLKSTAPPLDGARLRAQLNRDAFVLRDRRRQLQTALDDCDEQLGVVGRIRRRARLAFKNKAGNVDPLGPPETIDYKRYTSARPEISWTQSFVPVYRELEQEDAPRDEPKVRRRKNPVANFLEGWTPFKRARSPTRQHRGETWTPEMTSDEESALSRGTFGRRASSNSEEFFDIVSSLEFKDGEEG